MSSRPILPRRVSVAVAVVAVGGMVLAPGAAGMTGTNLVVHGDGETEPGPEWVVTGGPLLAQRYGTAHFPAAVLVGGDPFEGGTSLLQGSGATTEAVQTLGLTAADRAVIATGTVRARLSAHIGGYISQADQVGVTAVWRDAQGATVLTQSLAPVTPAQRGNVSSFLTREAADPVPADAVSADVVLSGRRFDGTSQDGFVDNVALHLVGIPGVSVSVAGAPAAAGRPTPVTWTIANSEDLQTKPSWRFVAALPEGVAIGSSRPVATTCDAVRVSADRTALRVDGALPAGAPACTVTADVVAPQGRYVFAPGDVRQVEGLRRPAESAVLVVGAAADGGGVVPPGPAPPPAPTVLPAPPAPPVAPAPSPVPPGVTGAPAPPARPVTLARAADALTLTTTAPATRLRVGHRTTVQVRVRNRSSRPVTDVDVCVRLPRPLLYLPTRSGAAAVDGRRCWTVRRLPSGASRTLRLDAKAARRGRATVRVTAEAAELAGTATTDRTTRVTR
jgi:hypothetical protein